MGDSIMKKIERAIDKGNVRKFYDTLKHYEFKWLRRKVIKKPSRVTFNPAEAEMQDLYRYMLRNTSLRTFLSINKNANVDFWAFIYFFLAISLLIGYIVSNATTF